MTVQSELDIDDTDTKNTASAATTNATTSVKSNPSSWDPKDDILLRHLKEVKKLGWKDISRYFRNRTPNACQFRWRRLKSGNLKSSKVPSVNVTEFDIPKTTPTSPKSTPHVTTARPKPRSMSHSVEPDRENYTKIPKIIIRSRRSSYAHPGTYLTTASNTPSRRASFNSTTTSTASSSRRSSFAVPLRRHSVVTYCYNNNNWSREEDDLLLHRNEKKLSNVELSILLPNKSDFEIKWRLQYLANYNHNHNYDYQHHNHQQTTPHTPEEDEDGDEEDDEDEEKGNTYDDDDEPDVSSKSPSLSVNMSSSVTSAESNSSKQLPSITAILQDMI